MKFGKALGYIMAVKHLKALYRIDYPIAISKSLSNMLANKRNFKVPFIFNGTDQERFRKPTTNEKRALRFKLSLPAERKIFISVGFLIRGKDPITTIQGFKHAHLKGAYLVLLGDGHLRERCAREKQHSCNINVRGNVDNVDEFLKASDYFISSSKSEGFGLSITEALATGLPCILSAIGPHKEILTFDPNAGMIVPVGDIRKLANAIENLAEMDYDDMSKAAVGIVHNHLNARKMSNKYQDLYEKLTQVPVISCIGK